jgi:hypothetical protein
VGAAVAPGRLGRGGGRAPGPISPRGPFVSPEDVYPFLGLGLSESRRSEREMMMHRCPLHRSADGLALSGRPVARLAADLQVSEATLSHSVTQDQVDPGSRPGLATPEMSAVPDQPSPKLCASSPTPPRRRSKAAHRKCRFHTAGYNLAQLHVGVCHSSVQVVE